MKALILRQGLDEGFFLTLTRWDLFNLLFATTDDDGQIHVDEATGGFYEQMREKAIQSGFDMHTARYWAAEKSRLKKQAEEEEAWQKGR